MKRFLFLIPILLLLMGSQNALAGQYSVKTGETTNIYCKADAPSGGWITHAFYELVDPNDAQYLALYSHSSDLYATVTGISPKSSVKIQVTYAYSYRGSYDQKVHVGSGTYYDYVTVSGGAAASDLYFNPKAVDMNIGETTTVKIEMTPKNTSSSYQWGVLSISSMPSTYDIQENGNELTITAKKKMSLYLYAETNNGLQAFCVIYAKEEGSSNAVSPTSISIDPESLSMKLGETKKINYELTPKNASTTIKWKSNDENICTVNSSGEVTAIQNGQTSITATTSNGFVASCPVTVGSLIKKVTLSSSEKLALGYQVRLYPDTSPEGVEVEWEWKSSDDKVASVDPNGLVMARGEGTAKITVTEKDGKYKADCNVTVSAPTKGTEIRNVNTRVQSIDVLINQAVNQTK